jgi:hypothetical protein
MSSTLIQFCDDLRQPSKCHMPTTPASAVRETPIAMAHPGDGGARAAGVRQPAFVQRRSAFLWRCTTCGLAYSSAPEPPPLPAPPTTRLLRRASLTLEHISRAICPGCGAAQCAKVLPSAPRRLRAALLRVALRTPWRIYAYKDAKIGMVLRIGPAVGGLISCREKIAGQNWLHLTWMARNNESSSRCGGQTGANRALLEAWRAEFRLWPAIIAPMARDPWP